ncbi:hypothetical protein N7478_001394 [Penicillium angulare]|uniref:uncharacterized protein n=1 Tax=Penicillium angulare TaxID=116970 RepID=UPI002541EBC1|nr:uncharacterized protein N7478_001394 [Penicillium angulare]KAJ5292143.1 hypothetical protein N7478_001394 [Penicillium angulare]
MSIIAKSSLTQVIRCWRIRKVNHYQANAYHLHEWVFGRERRQTRATILANLLDAFKILLDIVATERLDSGCERAKQSADLLAIMEPKILFIWNPHDASIFTEMKTLWQDPGVEVAVSISRIREFGAGFMMEVFDDCESLYHSIDRISVPEWVLSDQDIPRVRLRTTGISEIFFDIGHMT